MEHYIKQNDIYIYIYNDEITFKVIIYDKYQIFWENLLNHLYVCSFNAFYLFCILLYILIKCNHKQNFELFRTQA
jgi:hypothetical protein